MPFRRLAHILRDQNRNIRIALGLREPLLSGYNELFLPSKSWKNLCSPSDTLFKAIKKIDGNVNLAELAVLNALCRTFRPKSIMEIGTFDGRTTLNLSLNSDAELYTLDLPSTSKTALDIDGGDKKYFLKPSTEIGARFCLPPHNLLPCVKRIKQLYGDSASFDFSQWYGKIDFVFVDGAHTYEYTKNDSDIALKLLNPKGGIIVWHDYGEWEGVTRALHELKMKMPFPPLTHVKDTSLVVFIRR